MAMPSRAYLSLWAISGLAACACGAPPLAAPATPGAPTPPTIPAFEVHEWGLVRGTLDDHVVISGPLGQAPVVVMAKPVLYFHRDAARPGEAALVVDVDVEIASGRVVEHWPPSSDAGSGAEATGRVSWHGVLVQDGSCHGGRYPTLADEPCRSLGSECEAASLGSVETPDSDCLSWPRPPDDDGPTEAWAHLFYRGERTSAPALPLRFEPQPDGTLRVTATGSDPVPGRILRVRRAGGVPGIVDAAEVADPPAPGASITIAAPAGTLATAAEALAASLRAAGMTDDEVAAFRRSWDATLFGPTAVAAAATAEVSATVTTIPSTASPSAPPSVTTSVLYVLPSSSADALATLRITPAPSAVRRAIAVWMDEATHP